MTTTTPYRWVSSADTAKLIRLALRDAFPGVRFSVRTAPGGGSIRVGWTDGPFDRDVRKITDAFAGGRFDGMIDLAYSAQHWLCAEHHPVPVVACIYGHGMGYDNPAVTERCCDAAELVHFGADYVFTQHEHSPEAKAAAEEAVAANFGQPYDPNIWTMRSSYYDLLEGRRHP